MKVNDWSSVDSGDQQELIKEERFLNWLKDYLGSEGDQFGWTYRVAELSSQGHEVPQISAIVCCSQVTVRRKLRIIAELKAEFEKDYWWA